METYDKTDNPYEDAARNIKAGRFAAYLAAIHGSRGTLSHAVQAAGQLSEDSWEEIAFKLDLNAPSAKTVWLIQDILAAAEAAINPNGE